MFLERQISPSVLLDGIWMAVRHSMRFWNHNATILNHGLQFAERPAPCLHTFSCPKQCPSDDHWPLRSCPSFIKHTHLFADPMSCGHLFQDPSALKWWWTNVKKLTREQLKDFFPLLVCTFPSTSPSLQDCCDRVDVPDFPVTEWCTQRSEAACIASRLGSVDVLSHSASV